MPTIPSLFNNNGTGPAKEETKAVATTTPKATKEIANVEPNEIANKIAVALKKANENWPSMKEKAVACQAALSLIKLPTNDKEDAQLEKLLVKSKKTYELITGLRKETTGEFDSIKTMLMEPEKSISILVGDKDSLYHKGVKFRNDYATEKLKKQREAEAAALKTQNETIELSRLKGEFELIFHNNVVDYTTTMETAIANYFNGLQLEKPDKVNTEKILTWEDQIKKFSLKPALKEDVFESWFKVPFDLTKLSQEKYDEFVDQVKEIFTYEVINTIYVDMAEPKVKEWKDKLPAKKKELEDLAELAKTDKKKADALQKKQEAAAKKETDKITSSAEANKSEKAKEVQDNMRNENLGAQFETLKVTQTQEEISGGIKRLPIVNCEPQDIATVFSQALYHMFVNDGNAHLKKDKATGQPLPPDENGVPQYEPWANTVLKYVADKTTIQIKGIDFKEVVSTHQKSSKE